jgi:hypothetical protein
MAKTKRSRALPQHEHAGEKDGFGAEADGAADAAGAIAPDPAATTVTQRVQRDARLARFCFGTRGAEPGPQQASELGLARAALRRPAFCGAGALRPLL